MVNNYKHTLVNKKLTAYDCFHGNDPYDKIPPK